MKVEETKLEGCFIIHDSVFKDERGYFFESFNSQKFESLTGVRTPFVQDNQSSSRKGVLRGLHFQTGEHAQAKLVRVLQGSVLDVAVDLRKNRPRLHSMLPLHFPKIRIRNYIYRVALRMAFLC